MISKETIEEIKARTEILDVISDYVSLKKSGSNYRGSSPFNNERTPSFYVVPSKGFFKDFSSGKAGDAITFLMEAEGMSYLEAIKHLGKKYGIEVEEEEATDEEMAARNERESLFIVMKFAAQYYQDNLWKHDEGQAIGLSYFHERGFSDATIQAFGLGYSLDLWDGLIEYAKDKSYSVELLEKAGLIVRKEARVYDRFRGRVMFPIHHITGRVIAFGARMLGQAPDQPKYINSPETDIYHKSHALYGIYQAKQAIRQEDYCYLVEGYTDVISMYQAGIQNVVASSGTSLTHEQIKLISRYTQHITVLFDGDAAGVKASMRGIDMILEGGLHVKAVVLPAGEDPDSYARKLGGTAFTRYVKENQQDFIRFKIALYQAEVKQDPIKKAGIIREIVASVAKIPDPIQRQVYIKESSELLEMDESVLMTELNKIHLQQHRSDQRSAAQKKAFFEELPEPEEDTPDFAPEEDTSRSKTYYKEKEITRMLIIYGQLEIEAGFKVYHYIFQELEDVNIQTEIYADIHRLYRQKAAAGIAVNDANLVEGGSSELTKEVIDLVVDHYVLSDNWELKFNIYVPRETNILHSVIERSVLELKFAYLEKLIQENRQKLMVEDVNEQIKVLEAHRVLKTSQMEIARQLGIVIS